MLHKSISLNTLQTECFISRYCKYAFKNDTKIYINNEKEIHGACVWKIVCFCRFINKQYFIKYIAQYICNILSVQRKMI